MSPLLRRAAKGPFGPGGAEEQRLARLLLALGPGDRVLDVGCTRGTLVRALVPLVGGRGLVVGVDASADALRKAAASAGPEAAFVRADARALPFRDSAFDAVSAFGLLHLLEDPWAALDELARVLRRGGRLALLTTCRTRSAPGRTWDAFAGARVGVRMFERDEVVGALEARGFDPVRRRIAGLTQYVGGRRG